MLHKKQERASNRNQTDKITGTQEQRKTEVKEIGIQTDKDYIKQATHNLKDEIDKLIKKEIAGKTDWNGF